MFASQMGGAVAAGAAGLVRDGGYTLAWLSAAGLCAVAAVLSVRVGRGALVPAVSGPV